MVPWGERGLRERFDDAHHPEPQEIPYTHRCDLYLATDGSCVGTSAGLGALVETPEGDTVAEWQQRSVASDNNEAELQALHFGLDRLHQLPVRPVQVGLLLDHDALASSIVRCAHPQTETPIAPPSRTGSPHHWGGITARIATIPRVRVALVSGQLNPAHVLAHGVTAD